MPKKPVTKVTREDVAAINEGALFADGYDDCILGVVRRFGSEPLALYDYEGIIKKLMVDMSREDAEEFFEVNIVGAYVGENTPAFFVKPPHIKEVSDGKPASKR
jgi:hypothetical protein